MVWRGTTDIKDRVFSALVYLIPLFFTFRFSKFLVQQFPTFFGWLEIFLIPVDFIYRILGPWGDLMLFFLLFLAVVRNPRVPHFIRFNTMQALLLDILTFLVGLLLGLLREGIGANILIQTLYNVAFLAFLGACLYSIVQSIRGHYAEIPSISQVAYNQTN